MGLPNYSGGPPAKQHSPVIQYLQPPVIRILDLSCSSPSIGRRLWLALILANALFLAGVTTIGPVSANGRATLISTQEQGPYRFEVSILPSRAVVNNTHLSLRVLSLESEENLTEAAVRVSAEGPTSLNEFGPLIADNTVLPQFFETTLPFDVPGQWQVSINVVTELGDETVQVPMDVREGRPINLILVAAIAVAIIAVSIWTYDRIRSGVRARRSRS